MKTINQLLILAVFFLAFACQKNKEPYPIQIRDAEKIMLKEPTKALSMLDRIRTTIKNEPVETQRYYDLLLFRVNDMCYIPHPSNDTIQKCITYYTKHCYNDELMTAYYCMGCFYRDKKDFVKASLAYQEALNHSSQSKDFSLIGRLYNQLASLSDIPKEMRSLYKRSAVCFANAKDSITLVYSLSDIAMSFNAENSNDSAVYYGEKAYNMAKSLKDSTTLQVIGCQMADYYLKVNKIKRAKNLLDKMLLNTHNNYDKSLLYLDWGEYYRAVNNYDSAVHYYNKCLQVTTDISYRYLSFKALYDIYKKEKDLEKITVCADSLLNIDNENQLLTHDKEVTKQNIRFGVKRVEKENSSLKVEIGYHQMLIVGLIVIFLFLVALGLKIIKKKELRRREELKNKIRDAMSKKSNAVINEKIKQIEVLEENLKKTTEELERDKQELELLPNKDELLAQIERHKVLEDKFIASSIYVIFCNKIRDGKPITESQWIDFKTAVNDTYDNLNFYLKSINSKISEQEIRMCDLMKVGFNSEQMAVALNCAVSNTYSIRRRLYKKLTAMSGSSSDLDKWIAEF
jgi:tetratricopeptide (TPR) repeat protein